VRNVRERSSVKIRIEPKRIDRLANTVETVSIQEAEFWGIYRQLEDEEFGETYWMWVWDQDTLQGAYAMAVSLGDSTPELRAA
jgi:hypothetical protein